MTSTRKYRQTLAALLAAGIGAAVAAVVAVAASGPLQAQQAMPTLGDCRNAIVLNPTDPSPGVPPSPPTRLLLTGTVTVPGQASTAVDGLEVEVRINNACLAGEFTVGTLSGNAATGRYEVSVEGDPERQAGQVISFHLEDGTRASEVETYVFYENYRILNGQESGSKTGPRNTWSAQTRIQNLTFPNLPVPPPPPVVLAHTFTGRVFAPMHSGGLEGARIFASVGSSYTTPLPVETGSRGSYRITVDPNDATLVNQPITFFYEGSPSVVALWRTMEQPRFTPGATTTLDIDLPPPPTPPEEEVEPMVFVPQIYAGKVTSMANPGGITGISVAASIGTSYASAPADLDDQGNYLLVVSPPAGEAAELLNETIEFYVVGSDPRINAFQTRLYTGMGGTQETLNLVFPGDVGDGGGCTIFGAAGASRFSVSNLLLLAVPGLVVVGLRLHSRYSRRED